jgi:hypothetical protein
MRRWGLDLPDSDRSHWQTLGNIVMNLQAPYKVENFLSSEVTVSFPRRTLFHGAN